MVRMDEVRAWVDANVGIDAPVRPLGRGESYEAWLVDADPRLVVRKALRPLEELPRPMAAQLAALPLVPPDVGPAAIATHGSLVITTFVPGQEVAIADWTDDLLVAHARQLSVLHAQRYDGCGDLLSGERSPHYSMVERHAAGLEWWRSHHPEIVEEVRELIPQVDAFVAGAEPEFARLDRFALIHGDLVVTNVVVDGGTPRYIDWEWAEIGDPAADLALFGGPIATPPWYLPLDSRRLALFLDAYGADDSLRVRRAAYEVHERFFSSLHYRLKNYAQAVTDVTAGLRAIVQ